MNLAMTQSDSSRLKGCLNNLISLVALPALWVAGDLTEMGSRLIEALSVMLGAEFIFLRMNVPESETIQLSHFARGFSSAAQRHVLEGIAALLGDNPGALPPSSHLSSAEGDFRVASFQLGMTSYAGVLVAGSRDTEFPNEEQSLILNVASNQAALAAREATNRLFLKDEVIKRTVELEASNAALIREVADRQRAEEALRDSEMTSRLLVDSVPGLVAILSPDGNVKAANRQLLAYCGLSIEEFNGWASNGAIHEQDLPMVVERFSEALSSGKLFEYEARVRRHDRIYRWFHLRGLPFRNSGGVIVRWYVFLADIEERKQIESARSRHEKDLNQIINTIPVMAWSADGSGHIDFANSHMIESIAMPVGMTTGWDWFDAVHPDDVDSLRAVWLGLMSSHVAGQAEARLRCKDGSYRWFLVRFNPLFAEDGRLVKWYGTNTDIHDSKVANQDLRRSEAFLAQGQQMTMTGSVWWRPSTGEMFWSTESFRLFEYPLDQKPTIEAMLARCHPEDIGILQSIVGQLTAAGSNVDFEHRLRMDDGRVKHLHAVLQNVGEDGEAEIFGAITDITDRNIAAERLRNSEMLLLAGQKMSQTGTFSWWLDNNDVSGSEEFFRIFEFEPGTPTTLERIASRVHPEDLQILSAKIQAARDGSDNSEYQIRLLFENGSIKHIRGISRMVERKDGRIECIGATQDVTQRQLAEDARDKFRSDLFHVTRAMSLGEMAASIAHEVNQPLSGIMTNTNTCLRLLSADPPHLQMAMEAVRRTLRDSQRAADVISRLRALFKKTETNFELLDLNGAARQVLSLVAADFQRRKITVRSEFDDELPLIQGDRVQLQQVVLNLLRNAADSLDDGASEVREIVLRTNEEDDGSVKLTVDDTGPGLNSENVDMLFQAFHSTKPEGMGIGLSVSRSIIESHMGRIWAEARPDEDGASFAFSIPPHVSNTDTGEKNLPRTTTSEGESVQ
jgi:PAS domain S-box-containing protein